MGATEDLRRFITDVPDFPRPGVLFRDIGPLLRYRFDETVAQLGALFSPDEWQAIDAVAGIEARGFALAGALAQRHGKGFVPVRKAGKLPGKTARLSYGLEYGEAVIEMHYGSGRILLVDDVLATGGTLQGAAELAAITGYEVAGLGVLLNLSYLNDFSWRDMQARAVLTYE